jgi:protein TonB
MDKIARTRILLFIIVAAVHGFLIFFLVFNLDAAQPEAPENAQVMKLTDIEEFEEPPLPPPPPPRPQLAPDNAVESIAENMIETDEKPDQIVVAPGTLTTTPPVQVSRGEDYLPMHKISVAPKLLNEREIAATLRDLYPPIALRSGIEGRVILELFVDMNGEVKRIEILQETPNDRGFAEAAMKVFKGAKCSPAQANGEPVSVRWRYPVSFKIK